MNIAEWQKEILEAGELYRVGGSVRDELLGKSGRGHDTDYLVRGVAPDRLEALLGRFGRIELVGKSFGVYKFTPKSGGETIDIAFPRKERSSGPGHRDFDVDWDWRLDIETDLGRRDFTINAMARDVRDNRLIDPHGGRKDLENGILRMLFRRTFEEDPLRILRGIRFSTRLNLKIDGPTESEMTAGAGLLRKLSAERVQEELTRILSDIDRPGETFLLMRRLGALVEILPELDRCAGVEQNEYHPHDVLVHSLRACDCAPRDNLLVRWAALLHDVGKVDSKKKIEDEKLGERVVFYGHQDVSAEVAARVLNRLRYPKTFVHSCENLIRFHMFNYESSWKAATVRRFIRRVGEENLDNLFALRDADARSRNNRDDLVELKNRIRRELDNPHTFRQADLAVDGRDVMRECGLSAGPEIGAVLAELLEAVLDNPELNNRDLLLQWLRNRGKPV